jgi:NAD(P)H-hydrate repair Nnr-like enzyme with NAD(P)H-hydrate dehydratase domain
MNVIDECRDAVHVCITPNKAEMQRLERALFPDEQQQQTSHTHPFALACRIAAALNGPIIVQKGVLDASGRSVDVVCSRRLCVAVEAEGTTRRMGGQVTRCDCVMDMVS